MGGNEHSATDEVFGRIDLFGLPHEWVPVRQPLIPVRVGSMTPITVAYHVNEVASQPDQPPALSFEIQLKRRVSKTLAYSALKALVVIANTSHR